MLKIVERIKVFILFLFFFKNKSLAMKRCPNDFTWRYIRSGGGIVKLNDCKLMKLAWFRSYLSIIHEYTTKN
jgi:hypothetical protein